MNLPLKRRPLALACTLFLVSLYFFSLFYTDLKFLVGITSLAALLLSIFASRCLFKESVFFKRCTVILLFVLPVALSLIVSFFAFDVGYKEKSESVSGEHTVTATLTDLSYASGNVCEYEALITECDGKSVSVRALVSIDDQTPFDIGEKIRFCAEIEPTPNSINLVGKYDLSKGFICNALCTDSQSIQRLGSDSVFPHTHIARLRHALSEIIDKYVDPATAALVKAVTYGEKSELPSAIKNTFSELGISHTLAISGLHLGIVIGLCGALTKLMRLPKKARAFACLGVALFFVILAGLTPSVCRTFLMYSLLVLSTLFRRRRDPPTVLLFAVSVICLISPFSVFDVGLHLSFFSTLGILTYAIPITESIKTELSLVFFKSLLSLCAITVCANLFTLPYSIFYFGSISLISPVSNLVFIPLITLLLYFSAGMCVLSFVPFLARIISYPVRLICGLIYLLTDGSSAFSSYCTLPLDSLFALILGVAALLLIFVLMALGVKKRYALSAFGCYIFAVLIYELAVNAALLL